MAEVLDCVVCEARVEPREATPGGLRFNSLEGKPFVCERCVFAKITGAHVSFAAEVDGLIQEGLRNGLNDDLPPHALVPPRRKPRKKA